MEILLMVLNSFFCRVVRPNLQGIRGLGAALRLIRVFRAALPLRRVVGAAIPLRRIVGAALPLPEGLET
jgi:hypothetical protein